MKSIVIAMALFQRQKQSPKIHEITSSFLLVMTGKKPKPNRKNLKPVFCFLVY
jgi:hypothetical protein